VFPLPPIEEQLEIAAFLDRETAKIDLLVEEQRRLIELLNEKRRAVISNAVAKGLDPSAPVKASGIEWLGDIPMHWKIMRLRFAIEINPSKSEVAGIDPDIEVSFLPMEAIGDDGSLKLDQTRRLREVLSGFTYFHESDVRLDQQIFLKLNRNAWALGFGVSNHPVSSNSSGEVCIKLLT
jgi:type I restriction enzyme S subunit